MFLLIHQVGGPVGIVKYYRLLISKDKVVRVDEYLLSSSFVARMQSIDDPAELSSWNLSQIGILTVVVGGTYLWAR
jgi:hypothetical protein